MYIFDCKECGGRNEVEAGSTYITCAYCGKQITLPTVKDEDRARLFNRANYFRRQGEFDKAIQAFTGIVNQDASDPEATWGRVLARYGIEYVEDPRTGERIPTCNRVSNASILTDSDYLATLDNSKDEYTRSLYTKEAERIDKIQKGILAIAKLEEPFDVFICYKESTGGGSRTEDSVLAQDIYDKLTKEGMRVFFSRITLEDKLGQQYEPYIFAALNSAKVMLVVTTDPANVNSVWVKNEWSRYLSIMQTNHDKVLIPCYKKMDVYDLPEELNVYQSQDMGKIGAMQDLIRGVKKICDKGTRSASFHKSAQENTSAMLERGFICLRDADFSKAEQLFEQVLNLNPHEANAYLGKLMVERKVCVDDNLANEKKLLQRSTNYHHAIEYADSSLKQRLEGYAKAVESSVVQWGKEELGNLQARNNNRFQEINQTQSARLFDANNRLDRQTSNVKSTEREVDTLEDILGQPAKKPITDILIIIVIIASIIIIAGLVILLWRGNAGVLYTIGGIILFGIPPFVVVCILQSISDAINGRRKKKRASIEQELREKKQYLESATRELNQIKQEVSAIKKEIDKKTTEQQQFRETVEPLINKLEVVPLPNPLEVESELWKIIGTPKGGIRR